MVLASVADGSECWSGWRGLTDSLITAGQRSPDLYQGCGFSGGAEL